MKHADLYEIEFDVPQMSEDLIVVAQIVTDEAVFVGPDQNSEVVKGELIIDRGGHSLMFSWRCVMQVHENHRGLVPSSSDQRAVGCSF